LVGPSCAVQIGKGAGHQFAERLSVKFDWKSAVSYPEIAFSRRTTTIRAMPVGGAPSVASDDSGGPFCVAQPISTAARAKAEYDCHDERAPRAPSFAFITSPRLQRGLVEIAGCPPTGADISVFAILPQGCAK
jgi:hypothetical protein